MAAHQAPPSLGFSRQEHWSGLPFPSPMHESEKWKWSCSVSDSLWPHGLQPTSFLRPWDFPGKSTGVNCHCLLRNVEQLMYNWYIPRSLCLIFLLLLVSYSTKYINQMLELIRFQEKSLFKRGIKKVYLCSDTVSKENQILERWGIWTSSHNRRR